MNNNSYSAQELMLAGEAGAIRDIKNADYGIAMASLLTDIYLAGDLSHYGKGYVSTVDAYRATL